MAVELVAGDAVPFGQFDVLRLELTALDEEAPPPRMSGVCEQRQERAPVDEVGRVDPGHVRKGRREIAVEGQGADVPALGNPRSADDHRHPDVLLVGRVLAGDHPVLAHVETVVGGVDDVGLVKNPRRLERVNDALDHIVDRLQGSQPASVLVHEPGERMTLGMRKALEHGRLVADVGFIERRRAGQLGVPEQVQVARRRGRGAVRHERRDVKEERLPRRGRAPDHLDRLAAQHIGRVVVRRASIGHDLAVFVQLIVVTHVSVGAAAVPVGPARRHAAFGLVAVDVLAEQRGVVATAACSQVAILDRSRPRWCSFS